MKLINVQSNRLSCHPDAEDAFAFSQSAAYQYKSDVLDQKLLDAVMANHYPHVVKQLVNNSRKEVRYLFVSGWYWLNSHPRKNKVTVIELQYNLSSEDAKYLAWSYILSNQILSWQKASNLSQMKLFFDNAPEEIRKILIKNNNIKSTQSLVQKFSRESTGVVRGQCEKLKSKLDNASLFNRVLNEKG